MFSHELEYIFNKEYREWWDSICNMPFEDNIKEENKEAEHKV